MVETEYLTRRKLLTGIGKASGGLAMYQAMTALGHANTTPFTSAPKLSGAKAGTKVLVLGAGLAGLLAAYELRKAGYAVRVLEFQDRPGGRNLSLRSGDKVTEVGGHVQECRFSPGVYFNPGPWRIPHHHRALLHYCKVLGVELEPFVQLDHNTFIHRQNAFGGKPQRFRELAVDYQGHVSELLGKAANQGQLDDKLTREDKEKLIEALREWGLLDKDLNYSSGLVASKHRGYAREPGAGSGGSPSPSTINSLSDVLSSHVWTQLSFFQSFTMQTTMFQPKGGMDMIGKAFASQLPGLVTYNAKVTSVAQDDGGVTARWEDAKTGATHEARADWCVCTIPLPILSQLDLQVGAPMLAAIRGVAYSNSLKIGLEFRRRFWEEKDAIYGGHSFTDQQISLISYPNHDFLTDKPSLLVGAFARGLPAYALAGMTPAQRIEAALEQGSVFHPGDYRKEFMSGISMVWSRTPWILGCSSEWTDRSRAEHYDNLVAIDGRVVLAGEHASYYGAWMEGSLLSALDAVERLHQKAMA